MEIHSTTNIKFVNSKKIIDYLRFRNDLTKKDVAFHLGLSFATVSNICNELKNKGIVKEIETDKKYYIGRKPKLILLNYNSFFLLCLDLHIKDVIRIALLNLRNELIFKYEEEFKDYTNLEELITYSHRRFEEQIGRLAIPVDHIIGMGVAVSGIFDNTTETIICSEIDSFENQPLKSILTKFYNMPIFIDNESNLSVMSTRLNHLDEQHKDNILYVYGAEGLGIGIISQGVLIKGENGHGAEICHIPIGDLQYKCHFCNNYGCVETDVSIYGFVTKYKGEYECDKFKVFKEWSKFTERVKLKEEKAFSVVEENGKILGRLISILINLFDPGVVYIGGMIVSIFDEIYPYIQMEIEKRTRFTPHKKSVEIIKDNRGSNTILEGASEIAFNEWTPLY